jgi:hypothetical protein
MDNSLHDEIAALAYDLYEKNGRGEDSGLGNWLEAEKIVRARYAAKRHDRAVTKEFISQAPSPLPSPSRGESCNTAPPLMGRDEGEGDVCGFTNDRISKSADREYIGDERRMYERVIVKGNRGNIPHALNAKIVNMSLSGVAIETTKKLHVNMEYELKMNHGGNAVITRGSIVWSVLTDIEKKKSGDIVAVYRAGMKFQQPLLGISIS